MADRKLIYVDASRVQDSNGTVYKIGLYDKSNNVSLGLRLKEEEVSNVAGAEKIAILYAFLYIIQKDIQNAHILSDNQPAVSDSKFQLLLKHYSISVSWIPREANMVADRLTKLDIAYKQEDVNLIHMLNDLIEQKIDFSKAIESDESIEIKKLQKENEELHKKNEELNKKVNNQKRMLASLNKKQKAE